MTILITNCTVIILVGTGLIGSGVIKFCCCGTYIGLEVRFRAISIVKALDHTILDDRTSTFVFSRPVQGFLKDLESQLNDSLVLYPSRIVFEAQSQVSSLVSKVQTVAAVHYKEHLGSIDASRKRVLRDSGIAASSLIRINCASNKENGSS